MKYLILGLFSLTSLNINTPKMEGINQVINQLFIATDQQNWETVESSFADSVRLDYSTMSGSPAALLTPKEITTAWKGILPGFTHTHHQIGNIIGNINGSSAHVFCYGTATHFLENNDGNIWTVVGSYDFDLIRIDEKWKISAMKFNFKYQDGNNSLPAIAIENVQSK